MAKNEKYSNPLTPKLDKQRTREAESVADVSQKIQDTFYGIIDPRRRQERKDSRMLYEDHTAIANLPREPLLHEINQNKYVEHFRSDIYEISGDK